MFKIILSLLFVLLFNNIGEVKAYDIECKPYKVYYIDNWQIKYNYLECNDFWVTSEILEKQRDLQEKEFNKYILTNK